MFRMAPKVGGRGAGFRDFLRLPSAKENRSNRRTLPSIPEIHNVDLSNPGGVGKQRPAMSRLFPWGRMQPQLSR
jgi:hypothetical protein